MPVYEYQCAACSHAFEEWQKITEAAIKTCPKCGEDKVERLISQTAFMLKGGGWYKDLYSSSKSDGGGAKSDSKTETKSESKSDGGGAKSDAGGGSASAGSAGSSGGSGSSGSSGSSTGSGSTAAK